MSNNREGKRKLPAPENRLAEMRIDSNLAMTQAARILGIEYQTYRKYENGTLDMSGAVLKLVAGFFGCDIGYILKMPGSKGPVRKLLMKMDDGSLLSEASYKYGGADMTPPSLGCIEIGEDIGRRLTKVDREVLRQYAAFLADKRRTRSKTPERD